MNFNTVVSLPAAEDFGGLENTAVKLTATGVATAGATVVNNLGSMGLGMMYCGPKLKFFSL